MTYRAMFLKILFTVWVGIFSLESSAGFPQMPMQLEDIEKEMAEANRIIEEYVASLPPAEQAEFNRQVEEMTRQFESMSDSDFEKFLGEMFSDEAMMQPDFSQIPEPFLDDEVIAVPEVSPDQLKKVETALAVINDVIKQSNMFIVLINSSPELPNRINKWGNKGIISDWQQGMTWDTLKTDLEYFIQKLYKVQEQDLTTKDYKYLMDFIADESLYNNIIQLKTSLNSLLPIINIPEFGIQKINTQSKNAIQDIIRKFTENFYLLNTSKSLDAIFEKYEPQAKKIRDAEASASRRALEASREPRTPADWTEAGVEPYNDSDYGYGYQDYSYGGGYGGYDNSYSPYSGGYGGYDDYGYSPSDSYGSDSGSTRSGGGGGRSGGSSMDRASSEKKEKDKDESEKKDETEVYIPNDEITEIVGKIKSTLANINKTISGEEYAQNTPKIADLVSHISNADQGVNENLASLVLPIQIGKKIVELSNDIKKIDSLVKTKKINSTTLKVYQKEIKNVFDKNTKELKQLRTIITQFEPETKEEKARIELATKTSGEEQKTTPKVDVKTLSAEKKWAYFADETAKKELEESDKEDFVTNISNPKSLLDIKKDIDSLFKEVETFNKKKVVKPANKPVATEAPVVTPAQ